MIRIGARGSDLAQWQARWVAERLRRTGIEIEQVIISTHGDRVQDKPLRELGVQGVFTKEIEAALLDGSIDLAVHSFKDMAIVQPEGLAIVAISERADPADLLIVRRESVTDGDIPLAPGAIVGSSAVRRASQLLALKGDLNVRDLRGNVPTRLDKLRRGDYDAIFLAAAGIARLGLDLGEFDVHRLDPNHFIPSPAQGALAVEMRSDDPRVEQVRAAVHHDLTASLVRAERDLLTRFGGGCSLPLGAFAACEGDGCTMHSFWGGSPKQPVWTAVQADEPSQLAEAAHRAITATVGDTVK